MFDLNLLAVFARVAEAGSFAEAARRLSTSRSAVSKAVAKLEIALGARLLNRTTRYLSLIEIGQGRGSPFGADPGRGGSTRAGRRQHQRRAPRHSSRQRLGGLRHVARRPGAGRFPHRVPEIEDGAHHHRPPDRSGRGGVRHGYSRHGRSAADPDGEKARTRAAQFVRYAGVF